MSVRAATAASTAGAILAAYDGWDRDFGWVTRRAGARFAARDWAGAQRDAAERLALYRRWLDLAVGVSHRHLAARVRDRALWRRMREVYAGAVAGRGDCEVAETFFNSVTRRVFTTSGVDPEVEFLSPDAPEPDAAELARVAHPLPAADGPAALARALLDAWGDCCRGGGAWADRAADERRLAAALARQLPAALGGWPESGELLAAPFYRNKGAYLVGRVRRGRRTAPLVAAVVHEPAGLAVDALLTAEDDVSIVFGFAWSYFHVETTRPRALVAFLASVLPRKRRDELYAAVGWHKHAKTELYRTLRRHLARADARFVRAEGARGLVMEVFTLPSLEVVFKIIKDRFGEPKRTTRREVMAKYHFVFVRDRVGRLADAQEFELLAFRRRCFPEPLLGELAAAAPSVVAADAERVVIRHLYTERRLVPLDVYVRSAARDAAVAAVVDYGQAIRDLAAAGIFAGDLLLKNFGVSRHGRVIFYDYDELADLPDCRFRALPDEDDAWGAAPAPVAGEHDVFPEEFARFTLPAGPLRDAFMDHHAEILTPGWWEDVQARLRAGEVVDTYPYRRELRLRGAGA